MRDLEHILLVEHTLAPKPPKTTEWMAPIREHASMDTRAVSVVDKTSQRPCSWANLNAPWEADASFARRECDVDGGKAYLVVSWACK